MKIVEIVEVGNPKSLVRLEGESCDRILPNDTIIDIYEKQNSRDIKDMLYYGTKRKNRGMKKKSFSIIELIKHDVDVYYY